MTVLPGGGAHDDCTRGDCRPVSHAFPLTALRRQSELRRSGAVAMLRSASQRAGAAALVALDTEPSALFAIAEGVAAEGVVVVLDPPEIVPGDGFRCNLRRIVPSDAFRLAFGALVLPEYLTPDHPIGAFIPIGQSRMSRPQPLPLPDRDGTVRDCVAEAFKHRYQVFVLIHLPATLPAICTP